MWTNVAARNYLSQLISIFFSSLPGSKTWYIMAYLCWLSRIKCPDHQIQIPYSIGKWATWWVTWSYILLQTWSTIWVLPSSHGFGRHRKGCLSNSSRSHQISCRTLRVDECTLYLQAFMNEVFCKYLRQFVLVFFLWHSYLQCYLRGSFTPYSHSLWIMPSSSSPSKKSKHFFGEK